MICRSTLNGSEPPISSPIHDPAARMTAPASNRPAVVSRGDTRASSVPAIHDRAEMNGGAELARQRASMVATDASGSSIPAWGSRIAVVSGSGRRSGNV